MRFQKTFELETSTGWGKNLDLFTRIQDFVREYTNSFQLNFEHISY